MCIWNLWCHSIRMNIDVWTWKIKTLLMIHSQITWPLFVKFGSIFSILYLIYFQSLKLLRLPILEPSNSWHLDGTPGSKIRFPSLAVGTHFIDISLYGVKELFPHLCCLEHVSRIHIWTNDPTELKLAGSWIKSSGFIILLHKTSPMTYANSSYSSQWTLLFDPQTEIVNELRLLGFLHASWMNEQPNFAIFENSQGLMTVN